MKGLTAKQKSILKFIEDFGEMSGMAPTVYEIAEHFAIKTSTVFAHLRALQRKKFLTRSSKARSITLTKPEHHHRRPNGLRAIPVMDLQKPAAEPLRELFCDAALLHRYSGVSDVRNLFAVELKNSKFRRKGIFPGDIAIIRKNPAALRKGDVILTWFNEKPGLAECTKVTDDTVEIAGEDPLRSAFSCPVEKIPLKGLVVSVQRAL